jgi:YgiT-type zinc finger domain-containing protein
MEACGIRGCPGQYEERAILHLERWNGQPVVIDHVPAKVCTVCGDVRFTFATVERLDALRQAPPEPTGSVPLYEYSETSAPAPVVAAARAG